MSTMDTLVATTTGVSFLTYPSRNATTKASSYLEASLSRPLPLDLSAAATNTWSHESATGYDWKRSTEENYRSLPLSNKGSGDEFLGEFQEFRRRLDRSYHYNYVPARQALQDTIIRSILSLSNNQTEAETADGVYCQETWPHSSTTATKNCVRSDERGSLSSPKPKQPSEDPASPKEEDHDHETTPPWIVFTAGVYGAGKSHTIQKLQALGCFPPRSSFVGVDPDEIRKMLPEFSLYPPDEAGVLTQKEAGMIAELLTDVALSSGKNVVVDGSLRDAAWHEGYFRSLRSRFADNRSILRIGILYVTAPAKEIYQRVQQRGASTGRSVPAELLERSMREVPEAIERLRPLAHFFLHVHNSQTKTTIREDKNEETKRDPNSESFSVPRVETEDEGSRISASSTIERHEHRLVKSKIEATIFQEKCRSIVGY